MKDELPSFLFFLLFFLHPDPCVPAQGKGFSIEGQSRDGGPLFFPSFSPFSFSYPPERKYYSLSGGRRKSDGAVEPLFLFFFSFSQAGASAEVVGPP